MDKGRDWGISGVRHWRRHGVAMVWPLAYLWCIHGVPLAYPWHTYIIGNGNINFVTLCLKWY